MLLFFSQRIATATRAGGPDKLQLERFVEALQDSSTGLTYAALTGQRKQSVRDAEILFNANLAAFMDKQGYTFEAKFIRTILNWRKACDERGLSELERSHYNYDLLNFLLDDLMPWHREIYDFSSLEVNRYSLYMLHVLYIHRALFLCVSHPPCFVCIIPV